jgi:hypothetical protein
MRLIRAVLVITFASALVQAFTIGHYSLRAALAALAPRGSRLKMCTKYEEMNTVEHEKVHTYAMLCVLR